MAFKRLLAIAFCFATIVNCINCRDSQPLPEYPAGITYVGISEDSFVQKLQSEEFANKEFYVLAPQDLVDKQYCKGFGVSHTSTYQQGNKTVTVQGVVNEFFSVCNEEKYGAQTTDWGQYSGIPMNFTIYIATNVDYCEKIQDLKFEYHRVTTDRGVVSVEANLYNGKFCFASIEIEGYDCNIENLKSNLENYVKDYLMLKSDFLEFYKQGGIRKSNIEVEVLNLKVKRRLWNTTILGEDCLNECLWGLYADEKNTYVYLNAMPNGEELTNIQKAYNDCFIYAIDTDEDNNFIEPYHFQHLQSRVKEFCKSSHNDQGNIWFYIMVIPIPNTDVDLTKITFDWWSNDVVNLYYEDYLFATANFYLCSDCEKDVSFVQTYVEQYIRDRITKY